VLLVDQSPTNLPLQFIIWSDKIQIPEENLMMCLDRTGEEMFTEWSELIDPHIVITGGKKSRVDYLAEALLKWKMQTWFI